MAMNSVTILDNSDGSGLNMKQKGLNGEALVRTIGLPGTGAAITFKCDAAADAITDLANPVTGQICWANLIAAGKTRARFTFHHDLNVNPFAPKAMVMVNNGDEATALDAFKRADYGAAAGARTVYTPNSAQMISPNYPEAYFDLAGSVVEDITSIAVGFIDEGAGVGISYVDVVVW